MCITSIYKILNDIMLYFLRAGLYFMEIPPLRVTNDIFYKMLYDMILHFSKNTAVLLRDSSLRILMTSIVKPCMTRICHLPRARRGMLADSSLTVGMTGPFLKMGGVCVPFRYEVRNLIEQQPCPLQK